MKPRILPGPQGDLVGSVEVPSSKSLTNRALIAAAAMFFRKGIVIGGVVFVAAGIWFLYLALGRRR